MSIENPSFDEPQAEQPPQPQESGAYVPSWEKDRKDSLAARSLASLEAEIERRRSGAENFGTDEQISENRGIQELEREIEKRKEESPVTPASPRHPAEGSMMARMQAKQKTDESGLQKAA